MQRRLFVLALSMCLASYSTAQWTAVNNMPGVPLYGYFLLKDGRVLANQADNTDDTATNIWWTLTPDAHGSYINGTWTQIANSMYSHIYFADSVTPDGRVLVGPFASSGG